MATRRRRSAEEAQREIQEATSKLIRERGPDALRLQEIAAEVGMSHATVLHHVGSRETLLQRVAEGALTAMFDDLVEALGPSSAQFEPEERVRTALEIMDKHGHPRLVAWLALTDRAAKERPSFSPFIQLAHATRSENAERDGKAPPELEHTRFLVLVTAMSMLGDAVAGHLVYEDCGLEDIDQARADFRARLIALVASQIDGA